MKLSNFRATQWLTGLMVPIALVSVAAAQSMGGAAVARSRCVDALTTTVRGTLFDTKGEAKFVFDAQLIGARVGAFNGIVKHVPNIGDADVSQPDYELIGSFHKVADGRVYVDAFISLDVSPWGEPKCIVIGDFQGFVHSNSRYVEWEPTQKSPSGFCPGGFPWPGDRLVDEFFPIPIKPSKDVVQEPPVAVMDGCGHLHGRWRIG